MLKLLFKIYRKIENILKPIIFKRHVRSLNKKHPQTQPFTAAYQLMYFESDYSAHDYSLLERLKKKLVEDPRFIYGSTPWPTFLKILEAIDIKEDDIFIELGCGTGHLCFLVHYLHNISIIGIELLEVFVKKAHQLCEHLKIDNIQFLNQDILNTDISEGTIFFITNTCYPTEIRQSIAKKLLEAPANALIISITYPFDIEGIETEQSLKGWFSWGHDKIWIQRRKMVN